MPVDRHTSGDDSSWEETLLLSGRLDTTVMILAVILSYLLTMEVASSAHIVMLTLGGTKSHKVPFLELGRGLKVRGHEVTLVSAFPPAQTSPLHELAPLNLVLYVRNFTNWDLLGPKLRGEDAVGVLDMVKYSYQVCDAFYSSPETKQLLSLKVDLLILDGAYPECLLGLVHHFSVPFLYLNTVAFYTAQLSLAGSPTMFSVTPFLDYPHSDRMSFWERSKNGFLHVMSQWVLSFVTRFLVEPVIRKHLGSDMPPVHSIGKNVSVILQHGHHSVTYPRPYLPGVVEIACLHCKPVKTLPDELERFVSGGAKKGFIYVSFGTSVKSQHMPEIMRLMMVQVFSQLQYQVLWKYEEDPENMPDLPENVRLGRWLPQQDLLGHPRIKAFVSHGGLHSVLEAVYHAVPMVTLPVFCDQAANSFKATLDGYALALEIKDLHAENFLAAINKVISDKRYKRSAQHRSQLLRDQPELPLARALYWVEYVLRHRGAPHLQSAAKDLSLIQYFMLDTLGALALALYVNVVVLRILCYRFLRTNKSLKLKTK